MSATSRINLPDGLFADDEPQTAEQPKQELSPLERYLGRKRDPNTGALVPRKKRSKSVGAATFDRTKTETQGMIDSKDWEGCAARHLVALYDLMHEKCYGVACEMSSADRYRATLFAGSFVNRTFAGDYLEAVEFFRWVWTREMSREKWCRENNRERNSRIGLRLMFSGTLVTDYRVAMSRRR